MNAPQVLQGEATRTTLLDDAASLPNWEMTESAIPRDRQRFVFGAIDALTKRVVDIALALGLCIVLVPLFAVVACLVAIDGGPVFYNHRRVGLDLHPFNCRKFRTMMVGADATLTEYLSYHPDQAIEWERSRKLDFDPRVTPIGRMLRRTSLDELPQLFNVIKGDMSLVGPRPITVAEVARYGRRAAHYAMVRPGMTGLWQISGRNDTDYADRVSLDAIYARSRNVLIDAIILLATPAVVLSGRGAR